MRAMVLLDTVDRIVPGEPCLHPFELPDPVANPGQVLVKVRACGVCHTEIDEIEGRLTPQALPRVLGHQVVGVIAELGQGVSHLKIGQRVGVGWIASACGDCRYCQGGRENLCPEFQGTGYDIDGGYAEKMVISADYVFLLPEGLEDVQTAPLLCAGAIGYRALRMSELNNGDALGLMGFGASAHLVLQMAKAQYPQSPVMVFARSESAREFALSMGADWVGTVEQRPPRLLDAMIDTTPAWKPVVASLAHLAPGGRLVINAIRKEGADQVALQNLDYASHIWMEKSLKSVANITRRDIQNFLELAADSALRVEIQSFPLSQANSALWELKQQGVRGAMVLVAEGVAE